MITFQPLGGAQEVGASSGVLTLDTTSILIDAGIRPAARPGQSRLPDLAHLPSQLRAIAVTHAHIDHTGALPLVAAHYPDIPIFATESTVALMRLLLLDSVRLMEHEALQPDGETPLYDTALVEELLRRVTPLAFHQPFHPLPEQPAVIGTLLPAGHILGAAMLVLQTPEGRILHTGDVSVTDQRSIKSVDLEHVPRVDVVICEGTYGDRLHTSRRDEERRLVEAIQAVVGAGGRVLVPAFAVGRAQEVVLILKAFRSSGELSPVPIYIDGMCRSVCAVYEHQAHDVHPKLRNQLQNARRPVFADPKMQIFSVNQQQRAALLDSSTAAIIVATSGMLNGGPSPLYAAALAPREQDAILLTGYQDEESGGAALQRAQRGSWLTLGGQHVLLQCHVARYNLSAHADAGQLEHLLRKTQAQQVILVHGTAPVLRAFAQRLKQPSIQVPAAGEVVPLHLPGRRHAAATQRRPTVSVPSPVSTPMHAAAAPDCRDLYAAVQATGAAPRPWTVVELGQCYYGPAFHPALRTQIEQALSQPRPYFQTSRIGVQQVYTPQPAAMVAEWLTAMADAERLHPGACVVVQSPNRQGEPRLGVVTAPVTGPHISLIADRWKGREHPLAVLQLIPGVHRPDLVGLDPGPTKQALQRWRQALHQVATDLMLAWHPSEPTTFADVVKDAHSDDERMALALDLCTYGPILWRRAGEQWIPRARADLAKRRDIDLEQHLRLASNPGAVVTDALGRTGRLTGATRWGRVEVAWDAGSTTFMADRKLTLLGGG